MELAKNKQAAKNKQEGIKKAATLRAQGGGSSAQPTHAFEKRKHTSDLQSLSKGVSGSTIHPEACKVVADAPCHGKGKGLITSQGPVIPPSLPLLVKDKGYAVDIARSIVRDADLDECSEHETDPLGDSSLHDMMRVCFHFIHPPV